MILGGTYGDPATVTMQYIKRYQIPTWKNRKKCIFEGALAEATVLGNRQELSRWNSTYVFILEDPGIFVT